MRIELLTVIAATLALSLTAFGADAPAKVAEGGADHHGTLYHVVSLKFKPAATPEQIKAVEDAFAALKEKVPGITSLHWGTNVSPEKHNNGFTHCFVLTFATEKDRNVYLDHPEHKAFGKLLGPVMADVLVIDFWSKE